MTHTPGWQGPEQLPSFLLQGEDAKAEPQCRCAAWSVLFPAEDTGLVLGQVSFRFVLFWVGGRIAQN